jgi:hypothetical protein
MWLWSSGCPACKTKRWVSPKVVLVETVLACIVIAATIRILTPLGAFLLVVIGGPFARRLVYPLLPTSLFYEP